MSLRTSLFLALRYLKPRKSFITISMALSVLGPIIGVAVLVVVISVMNGFHREMRKQIFSLTSHLRLRHPLGEPIRDADRLVVRLSELGFAATPVIQGPVLVQARRKAQPVTLMGIDKRTDPKVTEIRANCLVRRTELDGTKTEHSFVQAYDELQDDQVLIGIKLQRALGLQIGDKLFVHPTGHLENYVRFEETGEARIVQPEEKYVPEELEIAGFFEFGMHQFDSGIIITTIDKAAELMIIKQEGELVTMDWGDATEIKIKTDDPFKFDIYLEQIYADDMLGEYFTWSWRDDDLGFFDALQTEKVVMFIILVLIVLVSAFCVCATLITVVFQKTREIGIVKAIGGDPLTIMLVFFLQGAVIGAFGIGVGILVGLLMVRLRNVFLELMSGLFGREFLPPALYFFDGLPAEVRTADLTGIGISAFVLCVLAAVVPAMMAMFISPSRAIRSE